MRFATPLFLAFLAVPLILLWRAWRGRRRPPVHHVAYPALRFLRGIEPTARERWQGMPRWLSLTGLVLLILALARPQIPGDAEPTKVKARNLMVILDVSSSMKSTDFKPSRLEAARGILQDFIKHRDGDLVGLVVFASRAFLQAPLTTDLSVVDRLVGEVNIGMLPDGTAIGTALALGLDQLKNLPRKACAIILITDGANNTGDLSPAQAAEAAKALGVRIHTIGLSSADTGSVALNGVWSLRNLAGRLSRHDETVLKDLAARTGGQAYRAADPEALRQIMNEIDPLERIEVTVSETRQYHELFPQFVGIGLALLLLEALLRASWFRALP